jgi:hypothetical protein
MPVIPALGRLKQEACEFKASLGYIERPYVEKKIDKTSVLSYNHIFLPKLAVIL